MKQNDKLISEAENIFEYIFENLLDGVVLADAETKKFSIGNRAMCRMLGYTNEELVNIGIYEIHPKESLPHIEKLFSQLLKKEIEVARDVPVLTKDGVQFYADIAASPMKYNGRPHLLATFRNITDRKRIEEALQKSEGAYTDITKRKQAENALRESERRLSELQKMAQLGDWTWDVKTGSVEWSEEVFNIFHLDSKEFTPQIDSILALSPWPEDHERGKELIRKAMESHEKGTYEQRFFLPDKSIGYYQSTFQGKYDDGGNLITIVGTVMDITERKRAEEALKKSEAVLKSLFNATPIGIGLLIDRVYAKVNNSLCKILGYSEQELLGKNTRFLYADENEYDRVGIELYGQMDREGLGIMESRLKRKDGTFLDAILCLSPFDTNDLSAGTTFTVLDITERKRMEAEKSRLEEMLLHSQKIESIGRLAGGVAHDFNNLLTAILGNTEMAMCQLDPGGKPYSQLTVVTKAAEDAVNLTRQLLAFSRKQVIEPKIINLNDLIEHVHKMILTLIGENIKLHIVPHNELYTIKADPGQIEQIIINLAANARDAMPGGGKLVIETSNAYLDEEYSKTHVNILPGDYVMMAITDTGMGMSKNIIDNAFEPFFTTKEKGYGTGLGLATVYGIVKQNGGTIEVYSEIGQGTIFKLYFPRSLQAKTELQKSQKKSDTPTGTETILIAEDKAQVLDFSRAVLMQSGYKVLTAESGEEALTIAGNYKEKIHLFMTDVILPGINGRVTAERLSATRPGLKVLYNSGYTAEVIDKHGILEQGLNFISKPFTYQELSVKVREVLDKK